MRLLTITFITCILISQGVAGVARDAVQKTGINAGVVVVLGDPGNAEEELVEGGKFVVEGLRTEWRDVFQARSGLAAKGLFPLANVQFTRSMKVLPYAPQLVDLIVADLDALGGDAPGEEEIKRVLRFKGKAYVKQGGAWKVIENPMPDDVDEWGHALRSPDRRPVSNDKRIQPHINAMKWTADEWKPITQQGAGMRIADGRVFYLKRGNRGAPDILVARNAFNGTLLWTKKVDWALENVQREFSMDFGHAFIAGNDRVYFYPKADGYLTAIDGATGEVVKEYTETAKLEAGKGTVPKDFEQKGRTTPFADPALLMKAAVVVLGERLLQVYGEDVWLLDDKSGKVLAHYKADEPIDDALVDKDGNVYLFSHKQAVSLKLDDLSKRWSVPVKAGRNKALTGPQGGYLVYARILEGGSERDHQRRAQLTCLRTQTGETVWERTVDSGSAHTVIMAGKVTSDDWKGSATFDVTSGEKVDSLHNIQFDMAGCSYATYTEDYIIRGLTLHDIKNPDKFWAGDGARPVCQMPTYPAYGQLFTFGTNCGCSVFWRAGVTSFYTAPAFKILPDAERFATAAKGLDARVGAALSVDSHLVRDWKRGDAFYEGTKGFNWQSIDVMFRKKARTTGPNTYYGAKQDELEAKEGALKVVAHMHRNTVTASKDGKEIWTFAAGGRIMVPPVIQGNLVFVGSSDGWLTALQASSGKVAWQFKAAPAERRMVAVGQVESAWPVLALAPYEDEIVVVAGRRDSFDDGYFATCLEQGTGAIRWKERNNRARLTFEEPRNLARYGFGGFGNKQSTQVANFEPNEAGTAWFMFGTQPISPQLRKYPLKPSAKNAKGLSSGLKYKLYPKPPKKRGQGAPDLSTAKAESEGIVNQLQPAGTGGGPPNSAVKAEGFLHIKEDGVYRFRLNNSNSKLLINGKTVVESFRYPGIGPAIPLEAGVYPIEMVLSRAKPTRSLSAIDWQDERKADGIFDRLPIELLLHKP